MYDNLYCKIYLDSTLDIEDLYSILNDILSGELEPIRTIKTGWGELDLRRNYDFDLNRLEVDRNDFIYWQYYLDVEPNEIQESKYIEGISELLKALKLKNIKAVASCDFEEAL